MWGQLVHGGESYSRSLRHIFISMMTSRRMRKKKGMINKAAICNPRLRRFCSCQVRFSFFVRSNIIFHDADLVCRGQENFEIMLICISIVCLVIFTCNKVK